MSAPKPTLPPPSGEKKAGPILAFFSKLKIADRPAPRSAAKAQPAKTPAPATTATKAASSRIAAGTKAAISDPEGTFLYRFKQGGMIIQPLAAGENVEILSDEGERRRVKTSRGNQGYVKAGALIKR